MNTQKRTYLTGRIRKATAAALSLIPLAALLIATGCGSAEPPVDANATTTAIAATAFSMALTSVPRSVPTKAPPTPALPPTQTTIPLPHFTWSSMVVDDGKVGLFTNMKLDQNDMPHIVYMDDENDDLKYAYVKDNAWKKLNIGSKTNFDGLHPSIALDSAGNPKLCRFIGNQHIVSCTFSNGKKWDVLPFISNITALDVRLAIDSKGEPQVMIFDETTSNVILYRLVDAVWKAQPIDQTTKIGETFPFLLGPGDQAHIAYFSAGDNGLKYVTTLNGQITAMVVDATAVMHPALALDPAGMPHISYYDVSKRVLKHASVSGGAWKVDVVDAAGDVGKFSSIIVAPNGAIHIAYYDVANKALKHALGYMGAWAAASVDVNPGCGQYTSIALDRSGNPFISYYDGNIRQLKLAMGKP